MEYKLVLAPNVTTSKKPAIKSRRKTSAAHKLRSVHLVLDGASTVAAARKYGDSQRAVSNWVRRFKKGGPEALEEAQRAGRPSKLTGGQLARIRRLVFRTGERSDPITGQALTEFVKKEFALSLTRQHARRILNQLLSDAK
jgi:transposase